MEEVTLKDLVESIAIALDCNQSMICEFTGLNPSTLSSNLNKPLKDLIRSKTGRRISALYKVVAPFYEKAISPEIIRKLLMASVFEDSDGFFDSVISSINSDLYSKDVLNVIAEMSYKQWQEVCKQS